MKRQIILDTETTGINPSDGHRIVEIGCVEVIDRKLTGNTYHVYINPERHMDEEVINVHGITNEFVQDKPLFAEIAQQFVDFLKGAEMIAHNAPFDVNFLNHELKWLGAGFEPVEHYCEVTDSLAVARKKHPGQKNSLDALCKRYFIDNSARTFHGALLDAEILAEVWLAMTGGQTSLGLDSEESSNGGEIAIRRLDNNGVALLVIRAAGEELQRHKDALVAMGQPDW